jgi:AcrR family transcriptional regulator
MPKHPTHKPSAVESRKQRAVLLLMRGVSTAEIARQLGVDPSTVRRYLDTHRDRIQEVFDERTVAQNIKRVALADKALSYLEHLIDDQEAPPYVLVQAARAALSGAAPLTGAYVGWRYPMTDPSQAAPSATPPAAPSTTPPASDARPQTPNPLQTPNPKAQTPNPAPDWSDPLTDIPDLTE